MKTSEMRQRGESRASDVASTVAVVLEQLRGKLADRLDEIDTRDLRKRADKVSDVVTDAVTDAIVDSIESVRARVRPPRRRIPVGLLVLGGAVAGAGLTVYLLSRRPEVRERAVELSGRMRSQMNGGGEESKLKQAVEQAIFGGAPEPPGHLQVDVEGRTVYLRGAMEDRGFVDQAIRKAQSVDGVAAVIDLVSA